MYGEDLVEVAVGVGFVAFADEAAGGVIGVRHGDAAGQALVDDAAERVAVHVAVVDKRGLAVAVTDLCGAALASLGGVVDQLERETQFRREIRGPQIMRQGKARVGQQCAAGEPGFGAIVEAGVFLCHITTTYPYSVQYRRYHRDRPPVN